MGTQNVTTLVSAVPGI